MPDLVPVLIYQLARECDWWTWLCEPCLRCQEASGWQKRDTKPAPHPLTCDHCHANTAVLRPQTGADT